MPYLNYKYQLEHHYIHQTPSLKTQNRESTNLNLAKHFMHTSIHTSNNKGLNTQTARIPVQNTCFPSVDVMET